VVSESDQAAAPWPVRDRCRRNRFEKGQFRLSWQDGEVGLPEVTNE
jgi:hypothetical protein